MPTLLIASRIAIITATVYLNHSYKVYAQSRPEAFTMKCKINREENSYITIDPQSRYWATMREDGTLWSKPKHSISYDSDYYLLPSDQHKLLLDRKSGVLKFYSPEMKEYAVWSCQKHDKYMPIPSSSSPGNKF